MDPGDKLLQCVQAQSGLLDEFVQALEAESAALLDEAWDVVSPRVPPATPFSRGLDEVELIFKTRLRVGWEGSLVHPS